MKVLYGVRVAGPWLSVATQRLTMMVSKWSAECDRRANRLISFIQTNPNLTLTGVLSTADLDHIEVHLWADADLNGDELTTKSTGGYFLEIAGLNNRGCPVSWAQLSHMCRSRSTPQ